MGFEACGGPEAADRLIENLSLPTFAPSLGGVETLITRPALTTHSGMSPEDRSKAGITDTLVRIAVGIEAAVDLCDDFDRALRA